MRSSISRLLGWSLPIATAVVAAACAAPLTPAASPAHPPSAPSAALQILTEPDQGMAPVYSFLASARRSLDMTMYELADPTAESVLAADAARGVDVRVILDRNRESTVDSAAFSYLRAHGAHVVWAPARYEATHEKTVVTDGQRALIMTMNLTSRYYATTRDFVVIDPATADAAAIETVFDADYGGTGGSADSVGTDLVWSPGAESALVALIDSAQVSLAVENEEMSDRSIVHALEAAARRGVRVEVTMTDTGSYHSDFSALEAAGVAVHTYPDDPRALYVHAKVVVVDGHGVFVGSQNFTAASLADNRELGLTTSNASLVRSLTTILAADFAGGKAWPG
jgi:phosphatidylserine/phosphatidylglycerophosphate/cardiolipin synthase-like enzyme